jgi:hypothetical protein
MDQTGKNRLKCGMGAALGLVLGVCLSGTASAEDAPTTAGRSPGDMTVEERRVMMQGVADYNACVYKEAMAKVDALPDIRQAADQAMSACEETIDGLKEKIEGYGFESGFAEQFTNHAQSRAVRTLLPELALRKSSN